MTDTRTYVKERYAFHLRIRRDRLDLFVAGQYGFLDRQRVTDVMTRWLARCVWEQRVVIGQAHIEIHEWWRDYPVLLAWAYAFRHVYPEDLAILIAHVDDGRHQSIIVPVPHDPPIRLFP